jgi:cytochrome c556
MHKYVKIAGATAVACAMFAGAAFAAMEAENRVKTMKGLGQNLGAIGKVAKGEMAYSMELVGNAEAVVQLSKGLANMFPEGSGGGETRAKPEIWANWADFEAKAKALEDAAPQLVVATKSGDIEQIKAAVGAVGGTCGGCHKAYRAEKKS